MAYEEEWIEEPLIAKRLPSIIDELSQKYPGEDFSKYTERLKEGFIPNPLLLEKTGKEALIVLAGLIHREFALIMLTGLLDVKITDDGRAFVREENRLVDVTDDILRLLPRIATACSFAIKNLSVSEKYLNEAKELINLMLMLLYMSVALGKVPVIETVITMSLYAADKTPNDDIRELLCTRFSKELEEMGLRKTANIFRNIIREK